MEGLVRATLDCLFGCHHSNLSRVFTIDGRTYRVCLSCGAEFDYSLKGMRTGHRLAERRTFRWLGIAREAEEFLRNAHSVVGDWTTRMFPGVDQGVKRC